MGNEIKENILACPGVHLGGSIGRAPACRAGDPCSNPGPGKNFFSFKAALFVQYHSLLLIH